MAALNYTDVQGAVCVEEIKVAYAHVRRYMDYAITVKGAGSQASNAALATFFGCALADTGAVFDAFDAVMAAMTTANNAGTPIDIRQS